MARWEPNARERLERAALSLFATRGYDATTVAQIADAAGLTRSTFFRHFADKREVLFDGQDFMANAFQAAIAAAPPGSTTTQCLAAALAAAAPAFTDERQQYAPARQAAIAAHPELQERELLKRARMVALVTDALADRGTDPTTARLAAELGMLAFGTAYARWAAGNELSFTAIAEVTLRELQDRAATLGSVAETGT